MIMALKTVIASGKGGVGKSTVCKGLAIKLGEAGKKTLIADCDAGLSSQDIMLGVSEKINFTWYDAVSGRCEIKDALTEINESVYLLPSPPPPVNEDCNEKFCEIISSLEEEFDIILLDAPAGIGRGLLRAVNAASEALIVATADEVSVKGAAKVNEVLEENGITQSRLLINRYDIKAAKKGRLLTVDELIDKTLVRLIGIVPEDKNIMYSTVSEKKLKTNKSSGAFSRIAKRMLGENVELTLSQLK